MSKSLDNFHSHTMTKDRHHTWCKDCCKPYTKAYNLKNKEYKAARAKKYTQLNKDNINKKVQAWLKKNPDKAKDRARKSTQSGQKAAMSQVHRAIQNNKLINLAISYINCSDCKSRATVYDHRDYNKPLEVEPVCRGCNYQRGKAVHRKENA